MSETILSKTMLDCINKLITENDVILFMKGNKIVPRCGFSKTVVDILNHFKVDFNTVNILENEQMREAIKIYSNWPTIPQLYIKQEFIGGCDIVLDMYNSGEMKNLLLKYNFTY